MDAQYNCRVFTLTVICLFPFLFNTDCKNINQQKMFKTLCVCVCVHYVSSCTGSTKSSPWYSPKWSSPCWAAAHDICKLLKRAAQVPLGSTTTTPPRPSTRSFIYARARSLASSGVFPKENRRTHNYLYYQGIIIPDLSASCRWPWSAW